MSAIDPDPVLPLASRRRALLDQARPIEHLYATMPPTEPGEAEIDSKLRALYREVETIEKQMAAITATSTAGLIEQMEALKAHVASDAPEHECLLDAVLRGLQRIQPHSSLGSAEPHRRTRLARRALGLAGL